MLYFIYYYYLSIDFDFLVMIKEAGNRSEFIASL